MLSSLNSRFYYLTAQMLQPILRSIHTDPFTAWRKSLLLPANLSVSQAKTQDSEAPKPFFHLLDLI